MFSSAHVLVSEQLFFHDRSLLSLWHGEITKGTAGLQSRSGCCLTSMCAVFASSFACLCWGACYRKRSDVSYCCYVLWVGALTHTDTHRKRERVQQNLARDYFRYCFAFWKERHFCCHGVNIPHILQVIYRKFIGKTFTNIKPVQS